MLRGKVWTEIPRGLKRVGTWNRPTAWINSIGCTLVQMFDIWLLKLYYHSMFSAGRRLQLKAWIITCLDIFRPMTFNYLAFCYCSFSHQRFLNYYIISFQWLYNWKSCLRILYPYRCYFLRLTLRHIAWINHFTSRFAFQFQNLFVIFFFS